MNVDASILLMIAVETLEIAMSNMAKGNISDTPFAQLRGALDNLENKMIIEELKGKLVN